jgi:murein DD-endopeptidase MepM/ murein hydrolase activator NlpD
VAALTEIEGTLQEATTLRASAAQQVTNIEAELAALEASVTRLDANRQGALSQLRAARAVVQRRAVASYVVAPASQLNNVLDVVEFNELSRRIRMLAAVVRSDRSQIDAYEAAKDQAGAELAQLVDTVERTRSDLVAAQAFLRSVDEGVAARTVQLTAAQAASVLAPGGFVFPVSGPHTFTDTFGAPRMTGTPFAHTHQGADVFAPQGTPLVACERGVLIRIGTDLLGGTKLWLVGASGTRYYYAHLSAFAAGVVEGKVVQAGDVVGYVGNTGNAATTPAHLHFEAHPGGGPAINPYLLLRATDKPRS